MTLEIRISGAEALGAAGNLTRLGRLDETPLLTAIARLIREQTVDRLQSGGPAPDGKPWTPNLEGRTPILFRSGRLARSIDHALIPSGVVVGSGLVYARIHQLGGVIRPVNGKALKFWWQSGGFTSFATVRSVQMPIRPYLGLSAENRSEIIMTVVAYLKRLMA